MAPGAHNKDFMKKHFLTPYLLLKSSVVQTTSATRAFLILLEVVSGVRHLVGTVVFVFNSQPMKPYN